MNLIQSKACYFPSQKHFSSVLFIFIVEISIGTKKYTVRSLASLHPSALSYLWRQSLLTFSFYLWKQIYRFFFCPSAQISSKPYTQFCTLIFFLKMYSFESERARRGTGRAERETISSTLPAERGAPPGNLISGPRS